MAYSIKKTENFRDEIDLTEGDARLTVSVDINTGRIMGKFQKLMQKLAEVQATLREYRKAAPEIYAALKQCAAKATELTPAQLTEWVVAEIERSGLLKVIYFQAVDALTMQEVSTWDESPRIQGCIAVQAGEIRLIDNVKIK